ncbi:hypothetical protein AAFF_G00423240 [Aldrovandia affinis]|uniref:Uncharacterized protein n=1 Tax=Aldrovandia affinis TaxID=143900 RepID=A0AAD7T6H2_9TELE|nr:hypothetical protein AAFF_G00423240 [Aldrovandia affinis]
MFQGNEDLAGLACLSAESLQERAGFVRPSRIPGHAEQDPGAFVSERTSSNTGLTVRHGQPPSLRQTIRAARELPAPTLTQGLWR